MAYEMTWVVPNTVLLATLHGPIPAEEVQIISDDMYREMESVTARSAIHLLIDVRGCTIQDKVWMYAKLDFKRHPKIGLSIVIGDSRIGGMVIAIFSKILNIQIRYSPTPEAALKVLQERDVTVAEYFDQ